MDQLFPKSKVKAHAEIISAVWLFSFEASSPVCFRRMKSFWQRILFADEITLRLYVILIISFMLYVFVYHADKKLCLTFHRALNNFWIWVRHIFYELCGCFIYNCNCQPVKNSRMFKDILQSAYSTLCPWGCRNKNINPSSIKTARQAHAFVVHLAQPKKYAKECATNPPDPQNRRTLIMFMNFLALQNANGIKTLYFRELCCWYQASFY